MKSDLILAVALMLAMPAAAQADEQNTDQHQSQQQKCRIQPGGGDQQKQPDATNLTEKLEPCAGVLKPPPRATGTQPLRLPIQATCRSSSQAKRRPSLKASRTEPWHGQPLWWVAGGSFAILSP